MNSVINPFTAQSLFALALRRTMLTAGSYAIAQALRLISNLILTRILFPEAFGVMAMALLPDPAIILLARKHRVWAAGHDAALIALSAAMAAIVLWINAVLLGLWVFCRYEVPYKTG